MTSVKRFITRTSWSVAIMGC